MDGLVPVKWNIFGLAILGSIGFAIICGIRDNYSLLFDAFAITLNYNAYEDGLHSLYIFYMLGSVVSQLPAAYVAHKFSAKWVMFFGVAINVVCTLLTPVAIHWGYKPFFILRILEGVGFGTIFPALHCMIATWSPPNLRTVISTFIYASMLSGGHAAQFLTELLRMFEWETIFYIFGGISSIWLLLWLILVQDNPNNVRRQRSYSNSSVPWRGILTSQPFWAIFSAHILFNCGMYIYHIVLVHEVFRLGISFGFLNLIARTFCIILAIVLDFLRAKQNVSTTIARKIATGISTLIPAISALILCLITLDSLVAKIVLMIGLVSMGANFSGFLSNHIDIAPNYAGILGGITNAVATIPLVILPYIVRVLQIADGKDTAWLIAMGVAIVCFIAGFFIFVIFGSGVEQSWNRSTCTIGHSEDGTIKATYLYSEMKIQEFRNTNS